MSTTSARLGCGLSCWIIHSAPNARACPRPLLCLYAILSTCSPSTIAPGEDEAPNPAEGLDPKVVEVYTKFVPSIFFRIRAERRSSHAQYLLPHGCQSRPAPTQLPRRPTSKTVQNHPFHPSMGAGPGAHRARAVVAAGYACSDADIHLEHEASAGARLP